MPCARCISLVEECIYGGRALTEAGVQIGQLWSLNDAVIGGEMVYIIPYRADKIKYFLSFCDPILNK